MNDREKQVYEKRNLEKLKTEMELVATRREHFWVVKLDRIDNDFNEWLEEKELSEEFKNILSEWHKNVENINKRLEEKRDAFKKDKEELQKRSNTASQPSSSTQTTQDQNQRNTSSFHSNNNER